MRILVAAATALGAAGAALAARRIRSDQAGRRAWREHVDPID